MTTQLMLPAPVGRDEPEPPAEPEPADPWDLAFSELRRWKLLSWVDGDEEDEL